MSSRGASQDAASAGRASEEKAGDGVYVTKNRSLFSMWLHGKAVPNRAHPAVVFRSADVIQEGYLLKQGLRLKMWSRRYFILRLEERHMTLGYYTSKDSLTLCSETPIGPGHVLDHVNTAKYPRRLELRCGTKVMTLEAEDQKAYEAWKSALQEAIRWNHAMVPTKDGSFVTYGKQASEDLKQEERSRAEAAKKLREKQRADEAAAAANAANKPKYLPATRPGTQCFMTSNTRFEIPSNFEYVKTIGSGAYGVVISATDSKSGKTVAIKNIQRAFDDLTDAKRIVREIADEAPEPQVRAGGGGHLRARGAGQVRGRVHRVAAHGHGPASSNLLETRAVGRAHRLLHVPDAVCHEVRALGQCDPPRPEAVECAGERQL